MSNTRKKYDEEFKKRAVHMSYSSERPATDMAPRASESRAIQRPAFSDAMMRCCNSFRPISMFLYF
jgi:hypothetical protein